LGSAARTLHSTLHQHNFAGSNKLPEKNQTDPLLYFPAGKKVKKSGKWKQTDA
jgi:hypothetical protein